MKILENELLIKYDVDRQEIITYRLIKDSSEMVLNTVYPISKMTIKGIHEAGRIIGEDILVALKATREEFLGKD
jgi:ferritin-like protein